MNTEPAGPPYSRDLLADPGELLETKVLEALGSASMCWDNIAGAGVFQSLRCAAIGRELVRWLRETQPLQAAIAHLEGDLAAAVDLATKRGAAVRSLQKQLDGAAEEYVRLERLHARRPSARAQAAGRRLLERVRQVRR